MHGSVILPPKLGPLLRPSGAVPPPRAQVPQFVVCFWLPVLPLALTTWLTLLRPRQMQTIGSIVSRSAVTTALVVMSS